MVTMDDISNAIILLVRIGAVARFVYCLVRLTAAEEQAAQYKKRARIDRIQSTAKQAAGKRLNELRRHEFDVNGEPPAELRYFYDLHSEILDNPDLEWVGDMEP